jgi:hypothetical protein
MALGNDSDTYKDVLMANMCWLLWMKKEDPHQ